jgi:muramidase (phage lysozyme)
VESWDHRHPENAQRIPKGAYIPLAAGAYQCIGKIFATMRRRGGA